MTTIRRAGDHALLIETGSLAASHRLDSFLRAHRFTTFDDIVPGPETVLVVSSRTPYARLHQQVTALLEEASLGYLEPSPTGPGSGAGVVSPQPVEVRVDYRGEDLAEVAELAGMSVEEVVSRHSGSEFLVGWLGFAPGFAYLVGLDPALHVPRLRVPRTSVPAGAVAIAGPYSAVYPAASPGGWRLLGRTDLRVWDVEAEPPSLLRPGMRVRMIPV
ncbi:5-oxoprolinase subunit B family protein [Acrocarpospora catenulata]|uniref:5-oxoprolinase subunit B family protein n=1 Tax=Acrocarpospora catenulata TaxID=2836182 RepID=UPI001BDA903D|nr:allophanate hydrolase subunit 1 [Acrocarpospora catenulata]